MPEGQYKLQFGLKCGNKNSFGNIKSKKALIQGKKLSMFCMIKNISDFTFPGGKIQIQLMSTKSETTITVFNPQKEIPALNMNEEFEFIEDDIFCPFDSFLLVGIKIQARDSKECVLSNLKSGDMIPNTESKSVYSYQIETATERHTRYALYAAIISVFLNIALIIIDIFIRAKS